MLLPDQYTFYTQAVARSWDLYSLFIEVPGSLRSDPYVMLIEEKRETGAIGRGDHQRYFNHEVLCKIVMI